MSTKLDKLIEASKKIILDSCKDSSKNLVLFSGGKDSVVLYDICKKENIPFLFTMITIGGDPDMRLEYIKTNFPDVEIYYPQKTIFDFFKFKTYLPDAKDPYYLQPVKTIYMQVTEGFEHKLTGERKDEKYSKVADKNLKRSLPAIRPLWDWTKEDINEYMKENNIPVNPEYEATGIDKTIYFPLGCAVTKKYRIAAEKAFPELATKVKDAAQFCYDNNPSIREKYKSADEYYQWYINQDFYADWSELKKQEE